MARRRWIGLAATVVALLAPAAAEAAEAVPIAPPVFELEGSHGYLIGVLPQIGTGSQRDYVLIEVTRGSSLVYYSAPATFSDTGASADLGELGRVALTARPSGRVRTAHPSCGGPGVRYESATYVGEFVFRGEDGYTEASATTLPGLMQPAISGDCYGSSEESVTGPEFPGASLRVRSPRHIPGFHLLARKNGPKRAVELFASVLEQRGAIQISRSIRKRYPHTVFSYDRSLDEARLAPPAPFSGSAVYRAAAPSARRWTGNLSVDLPGRPDVPATGRGFRLGLEHGEWEYEATPGPFARGRPTLPAWPSTKPWPTAFATSSPLGPS